MHVLHVIDGLGLGGAERMLVAIANRTAGDGHRVNVCVTRTDTTLASELARSVELVVLERTGRWDLAPVQRLVDLVHRGNVDVIHCHGRSSFSLIALLVATRRIRAAVLLHDHLGVELHPQIPRWFRVARYALDAYVGLYAQHDAWARRAGVPATKIHVIPNAMELRTIDDERGAELPPAPGGAVRLVAVGGLRREKAVDVLLDAIAQLAMPVRLFVIGGDLDLPYAQALRERAARPDLAGRVEFLGARRDALALARTADLAVHAARSESGPLVLLEYAARAIPFVSTPVGGIAEGLETNGIGWFAPPENAAGLAARITEALALPPAARRAKAAAWREAAIARYDLSIAMPRWYELYARLEARR